MASWYGTNKNGGYKNYGSHEPGYGNVYPDHVRHPAITDAEGRMHEITAYATVHNAQRYVTSTEEVVEFRRAPGKAGHKLSPLGKDVHPTHGKGSKPHLVPWSTAPKWSEKDRELSPKAHKQVVHGHDKSGSPRNIVYRHNSPPYAKTHNYGEYSNSSSDDDEDDEDDDVVCNDGVCYPKYKGGTKPNHHFEDEDCEKQRPKSNTGYAPPAHSNYTVPPSYHPHRETSKDYYDIEKPKGYNYADPYAAPPYAFQPQREPYYATANDYYDDERPKGINGYAPTSYTVPVTTPPKKDTSYEPSNNRPFTGKTRPNKTTNNSPLSATTRRPRLNGSPTKDNGYPETIDSAEARRRYGGVASSPARAYEEKHKGTIDSREAARKYKGVFVPTRK